MKLPTTPYAIGVQETFKITREFLVAQGWILDEEKPLYETYNHKDSDNLKCHIGLYGEFSITYLHWINKTPEKYFSTINNTLTEADYFYIVKLLNLNI